MKQIAKKYERDHSFAVFLRTKGIRECDIISFMIEDINTLTIQDMEAILRVLDNNESAEQFCLNVLENSETAKQQASRWLSQENEFAVASILILYARVAQFDTLKPDSYFEYVLEFAPSHFNHRNIFMIKSMARALRQIALRNELFKQRVISLLSPLKHHASYSQRLIYEEVVPLIS
jgi:3-methyladenine DNA glycosylase AlkD